MLSLEQKKVLKQMTYQQKMRAFLLLRHSAWELKYAGMKQAHPEWSSEQLNASVRKAFLHAGS